MNPAAKAPKRPTTSWSATAEAGESLVRDDIERQSPCDFRCRSGGDGQSRGRARDCTDRGKSQPRGGLPDRRLEPEEAFPVARQRRLAQPDSVAARALVQR